MFPEDLRYTSEHEWVRGPDGDGTVRVGITDFAQEALGDIVYVQLPEVGEELESGTAVGELESTKSVSDLYAPLAGTVVSRNESLEATPELVNSDPYGDGWLLEIRPADPGAVTSLLSADDYRSQVESEQPG